MRREETEEALRQALMASPQQPAAWRSLGACLFAQRRWDEAAEAFHQHAALDPQDAAAWSNLGAAEQNRNELAAAREAYERSLAIAPDRISTLTNYAALLAQLGQPQQALELLSEVLARDPSLPAAWVALGKAWQQLENWEQSTEAFHRAVELAPQQFEMRYNLAYALFLEGRVDEAEQWVRQIVEDEPQSADAWWLLGTILLRQARHPEARQALERAVEIAPNPSRHSSLLVAHQYSDDATAESLLAAHKQWDAAYAEPLFPPVPTNFARDANQRPLRIGFVSADFCRHPVGFLLVRALECLDKNECSAVCYSDLVVEDAFTARFRATAELWRNTAGLSDDELAAQIRQDEIDVLVDLMGHTGKRLLVFAARPAPVQITWLGYVGATGLRAMDFLLADRFHVRAEEEEGYTENVLRLPDGYACYGPLDDAPSVGPLPARATGSVTFGCFNNPVKFSQPMIDAWAAILERVPGSRLLLKFGGLDQPTLQARLLGQFMDWGVNSQRIILEGRAPHRELLDAYNRVDLALDTQPYSGGLTTCEALWMGVPVITLPGRTFAGRHAVSHLSTAGYEQFIAPDIAGYIDLAASWANRLDELANLRFQMREQVRQSPLCDARRFADNLAAVFRQAWESRMHG